MDFGLKATFSCANNESITGRYAEFVVTGANSKVTATLVDGGDYAETIWNEYPNEKKEIYSELQSSNYTLIQDDYTAIIPAGFAYGTSANVGTIANGLVITDNVDENGNSIGNEFVWIPVDKDILTVGKTNKKIAELQGEGSSDYRGVLYDWNADVTGNTRIQFNSNGYREPDVINYDLDGYSDRGITETTMKNSYNAMIASVKQYGGFYAGRYELGLGNDFSKVAVVPASSRDNETYIWYGLYSKANSYNKSGVTSQMIWGSQYDAILNFALTNSTDSSKINSNQNGNHSGKIKTGVALRDKMVNICDIEGNMLEWTQEAHLTNSRVIRGGSGEVWTNPIWRSYDYPPTTVEDSYYHIPYYCNGSRMTLYINL